METQIVQEQKKGREERNNDNAQTKTKLLLKLTDKPNLPNLSFLWL